MWDSSLIIQTVNWIIYIREEEYMSCVLPVSGILTVDMWKILNSYCMATL